MNYYYRYVRRGDDDYGAEHIYENVDGGEWRESRDNSFRPFSGWIAAQDSALRTLPWIGGTAIGIGLLILLFPMLLVAIIAGLFFMAGAICLSLWWQLRPRRHRIRTGTPWWQRAENWLQQKLHG